MYISFQIISLELRERYSEIKDIELRLKSLEECLMKTSILNIFKIWDLKEDIKKLRQFRKEKKNEFDVTVDMTLQHNVASYKSAIVSNFELLTKNQYLMKVYKTDGNGLASTEESFKGYISDKGFLYLFVEEINMVGNNNQTRLISRIFNGNFNILGDFKLVSQKMDSDYFAHIPVSFDGFASKDGKFRMEAKKERIDFMGYEYIKRIISDPFNENSNDRHSFLDNRKHIIDLRQNLSDSFI